METGHLSTTNTMSLPNFEEFETHFNTDPQRGYRGPLNTYNAQAQDDMFSFYLTHRADGLTPLAATQTAYASWLKYEAIWD